MNSDMDQSNFVEALLPEARKKGKLSDARRKSSTVLQLGEDATWKDVENHPKSNCKGSASGGTLSAVIKMSKKPEFSFRLCVGFFLLCIMILIVGTFIFDQKTGMSKALRYRIMVSEEQRHFVILNNLGKPLTVVHYGLNLPQDISPVNCALTGKKEFSLCQDWSFRGHLKVRHEERNNDVKCYEVSWMSYSDHEVLRDCIELGDGFWFGMGQTSERVRKPLNGWRQKSTPFVSDHRITGCDHGHDENGTYSSESVWPFGSIIKRYWLSSRGFTVEVPLSVPLWISYNSNSDGTPDHKLCFEARTDRFPFKSNQSTPPHLNYTICASSNLSVTHTEVAKKWISWSVSANSSQPSPQALFLEKPIWYINDRIMAELEQSKIESYINQTIDFGPLPGLLLIDTKWQPHLGDIRLDKFKFPEPSKVFTGANRRGFKIMFSVHPLIQSTSPLFYEALRDNRVFTDKHSNTPLITRCEPDWPKPSIAMSNSFCTVIDLYNETTREWFTSRLMQLANYTISGLLFKGIPVSRMPRFPMNANRNGLNPDSYQTFIKRIAESTFGLIGMDTLVGSEGISGFAKIGPLTSSWESLRSIIPTVLSIGLVGYPLINTGSIGGDLQVKSMTNISDATELYIRWAQLATFLPVLQFSDVPNGNLVLAKTVKRLIDVREHQVIPLMKNLMDEYMSKGLPIIRPVWWLDSEVRETYSINDQFAVGNDMLVAPVLTFNTTSRDIFLPSGWWKDQISGQTIRGGKWMRNYQVELFKVAFFTRLKHEP